MEEVNILKVLIRVLHIAAAIISVGGTVFVKSVLRPSMSSLAQDARGVLQEDVRRRFAKLFMLATAVLLLSGFYNYLHNEIPAHQGQAAYHAMMGAKILFALIVFFLGGAVLGRAAMLERFRRNDGRWITVNIVLALFIVLLAALLRAIPEVHAFSV